MQLTQNIRFGKLAADGHGLLLQEHRQPAGPAQVERVSRIRPENELERPDNLAKHAEHRRASGLLETRWMRRQLSFRMEQFRWKRVRSGSGRVHRPSAEKTPRRRLLRLPRLGLHRPGGHARTSVPRAANLRIRPLASQDGLGRGTARRIQAHRKAEQMFVRRLQHGAPRYGRPAPSRRTVRLASLSPASGRHPRGRRPDGRACDPCLPYRGTDNPRRSHRMRNR